MRLEIFKPTNGAVDVFRFKNEDGSYNSRILVKDNEIKVYSFDKNVNVKFELNLDDDSIKVTHNNLETDVETMDIDIVNIVGKIFSTMFGNECKYLRDCELKFKNLFLATRSALVLSILDLYRRWIDMLQLEISNIQHEASQIAIELYNPESEISKLGRDGFYDKMAEYYNRIDYLERMMERIQKYMYDQNIKGKYQK